MAAFRLMCSAIFGMYGTAGAIERWPKEAPGQPKHPPVIVHVLVDDLGYADLGYVDKKLVTPHIDALRSSGIGLSSYYAWKYCNPSRAMLLTGRYMHNVGIYSNGGAPSLNFTLLPERLKQASPSLRAVMIGKW
jgi:arylsulfatase A-like enzyme